MTNTTSEVLTMITMKPAVLLRKGDTLSTDGSVITSAVEIAGSVRRISIECEMDCGTVKRAILNHDHLLPVWTPDTGEGC
jgi:hypothetical protein